MLSGGERNRLNLALTLKMGGNMLLLDEPTNDLDVETLSSLEDALLEYPGCAVVTSHDRWFLDRVATHILAWEGDDEDAGKWFWFEGNFASYEENKIERLGAEAARPAPRHPPPPDPRLTASQPRQRRRQRMSASSGLSLQQAVADLVEDRARGRRSPCCRGEVDQVLAYAAHVRGRGLASTRRPSSVITASHPAAVGSRRLAARRGRPVSIRAMVCVTRLREWDIASARIAIRIRPRRPRTGGPGSRTR